MRALRYDAESGRPCYACFMPTWISETDAWLGRTLFFPIIIRICQATGQTQHTVGRLLWFVACACLFSHDARTWYRAVIAILCVAQMLRASLWVSQPANMLVVRALWWLLFSIDVLNLFKHHDIGRVTADLLILFAEYAFLVRTIPPQGRKSSVMKGGASV
ncbi:hypothetical protein BH10PSE12_BH10PSE12_37610 [soil metagenome]